MKFRIVYQQTSNSVQSPVRIVEQITGREVGWVNRYLEREYIRRLADKTLRIYAHNLLHFVRWWDSVHHTDRERKKRSFGNSAITGIKSAIRSICPRGLCRIRCATPMPARCFDPVLAFLP